MPYRIEQQADQWCVVKDEGDSSETLVCYPDQVSAEDYLTALNINVQTNETALNLQGRISEMLLVEAASPLDTKPRNARLTLECIKPGWGTSAYYPADVLKRDGPIVFKAGQNILSFFDHPEEGASEELDKLAGRLVSDGVWDEKAQAIVAQAEVYPNKIESLRYCWGDIGISIRGEGVCAPGEAEGRTGAILQSLTKIYAVDYVTRAGAGGRIVSLEESLKPKGKAMPTEETSANALTEASSATSLGASQYDKVLQELSALRNQVSTTKTAYDLILEENRKLHTQQSTLVATSFLKERLSQIDKLPPIAREKLAIQLVSNIPMEGSRVDTIAFDKIIREAAIAESSYQATYQEQLIQSGRATGLVRGMGGVPQAAGSLQDTALQQLREGFLAGGLTPAQAEIAMRGIV
jgi:hypothetical protein